MPSRARLTRLRVFLELELRTEFKEAAPKNSRRSQPGLAVGAQSACGDSRIEHVVELEGARQPLRALEPERFGRANVKLVQAVVELRARSSRELAWDKRDSDYGGTCTCRGTCR